MRREMGWVVAWVVVLGGALGCDSAPAERSETASSELTAQLEPTTAEQLVSELSPQARADIEGYVQTLAKSSAFWATSASTASSGISRG